MSDDKKDAVITAARHVLKVAEITPVEADYWRVVLRALVVLRHRVDDLDQEAAGDALTPHQPAWRYEVSTEWKNVWIEKEIRESEEPRP